MLYKKRLYSKRENLFSSIHEGQLTKVSTLIKCQPESLAQISKEESVNALMLLLHDSYFLYEDYVEQSIKKSHSKFAKLFLELTQMTFTQQLESPQSFTELQEQIIELLKQTMRDRKILCKRNVIKLAKQMINNPNTDILHQDKFGNTAFHSAVKYDYKEIAEALLEQALKRHQEKELLTLKDNQGQTVIDVFKTKGWELPEALMAILVSNLELSSCS